MELNSIGKSNAAHLPLQFDDARSHAE